MSEKEPIKKVRISIQKEVHNQIISEEDEYTNQKQLYYSKHEPIKHLKDQNVYSLRSKDVDSDQAFSQESPIQSKDLVYNQLDKWKKDLLFNTSKNSDEFKRMRKDYENSIQFDQSFPKINMEIIDSITRDPNHKRTSLYYSSNELSTSVQSLQALSPFESNSQRKSLQQMPSINQSFTSIVDNDMSFTQNKKPNLHNRIYTTSNGRKIKYIQNNESIQREVNKKIVQNLIFNRIQRTIEGNQTFNKSENQDKSQLFTNKQRTDDILKTEMNHFQNQTLNNFKNLVSTFHNSNNLIEYGNVQNQISNYLNRPRGIFETAEKKNEFLTSIQDEKEEKYHFQYMEKVLLDNYQQLCQEINNTTNQLKNIRQNNNVLQNQIADNNEQTKISILQAEKEIQLKEKDIENSNKTLPGYQITIIKKNLKQIQEDKEDKLQKFKKQKDQILSQINVNTENLNTCERNVKILKEKKNITRNMLKTLYLSSLKNNKTLQKQSMVWIVSALLNINEDITSSNIFPSIIDKQSIQYLVEYAVLESNYTQIQNKLKQTVDDPSCQQRNDKFDQEYLLNQQNLNQTNIKDKVQKIALKSNLKVKRPIFSSSSNKDEYQLVWEEDAQDYKKNEEIAFSLSKVPTSKLELINSNKDAREEIKQIKIKQKKLKENESNRLIELYLSYQDEKKTNELKQILLSLFGEAEGEEYFKIYKKKYLHLQFQIKNNKTFTFSKQNQSPLIEKDTSIKEQIKLQKINPLNQTNLNYRRSLNNDNNKLIDSFSQLKSFGSTFNNIRQNNFGSASQFADSPLEFYEQNKKQKISTENNIQSSLSSLQSKNSTKISLDSMNNLNNNNNYAYRQSQLFSTYASLPQSLTHL